jgi:endoplasmic reticulum-Golgi intermediate compartment protein 3
MSNGYDASFSYSGGYSAGSGGGGGGGGDYYGNAPAYGGDNAGSPTATLRRRNAEHAPSYNNGADTYGNNNRSQYRSTEKVVKQLDFMFPKVEIEHTVQTERGGAASLVAYGLIAILVLAECFSWMSQNYSQSTVEHITVDTSLGKKMRVNLEITFPALACEDLHIDIMDIAGDSQLDLDDTMVKRRLNMKGQPLGKEEVVESNIHQIKQAGKDEILKVELPADYCGPCYGASEKEGQCCNTCDELIEAYKSKRWRTDLVTQSAEQCIREGRDKIEPKKMRRGEGCHLEGYFSVNRVGGNFHIAMGEGIERDGRHIHTFNPEDTHNFNASHTIHHLSFGPAPEGINSKNQEFASLNGVSKVVTKEFGTTGLFQYFIKIVPTTYVGSTIVETNRYFYTERFRPLMREVFEGDDEEETQGVLLEKDETTKRASVQAGHAGKHSNHDHHNVKKNSVLPGVFFIYEIYPFEVEVSPSSVPLTHLLIQIMATVGGVLTIMRWADSFLHSGERRR